MRLLNNLFILQNEIGPNYLFIYWQINILIL
jgi:hypothetical protein